MWIYEQATGKLRSTESGFLATGYSGYGDGKNDPRAQSVPGMGPIPCGVYAIGGPFESIEHGPYAMRLTADAANQMFGRGGFLMHGDSLEHPGCASKGCIIMPRDAREEVWASGDRELQVFAGGMQLFAVTDADIAV